MDNVRIRISDGNMTAYMMLTDPGEGGEKLTYEKLRQALDEMKVSFGVDKSALTALSSAPMYGDEFPVACGKNVVNGTDGRTVFSVEKSDEFKPDYGGDGEAFVDYKNVDVFQLVKKEQTLCEVVRPTRGEDGINVFGATVTAVPGKAAANPQGANTEWSEDGLRLMSMIDGVVNFNGVVVNVMEILNIDGDVDLSTGNIKFGGDVNVNGSVQEGFSIECGGNLTIRGRLGNANVNVGGNLVVSEGINSTRQTLIRVDGFVKTKYVESGNIQVKGDLYADYITSSSIECEGNMLLSGQKSVILGGVTSILGELQANFLGNERGIKTEIRLMKTPTNEEKMAALSEAREKLTEQIKSHMENINKIKTLMDASDNPELDLLYKQLTRQLPDMKDGLHLIEEQISNLVDEESADYPGRIVCRKKLYSGVNVSAGPLQLHRDGGDMEFCKLYINDKGEWVNALA